MENGKFLYDLLVKRIYSYLWITAGPSDITPIALASLPQPGQPLQRCHSEPCQPRQPPHTALGALGGALQFLRRRRDGDQPGEPESVHTRLAEWWGGLGG